MQRIDMTFPDLDIFACPASHEALRFEADGGGSRLVCRCGAIFPLREGLADLTYPQTLAFKDASVRAFYDGRADVYDDNLPMTFLTHFEDEARLRGSFVDALELQPGARVLEVACGTGRDSVIIAERLGRQGHLCVQDISPKMLAECARRLQAAVPRTSLCLSNAAYLPFPDHSFDAVYSFGGLGEFSDIGQALRDMVRVAKVGAKIVVGDESMPPWLRETEFAKILITTNRQFLAEVPLKDIPVEAREFRLRYVLGGVFYLIDFRVGDGEPKGNFDFEIAGPRGGTLRTRYYGQLEGVTPQAKALADEARQRRGLSMHAWLDQVVREAAGRDLKK
jgi:ubiquinone/menaquinone biosynthesis C-methylase UbiE